MKNYLKAFLAMGAFLFASVVLADTTGVINSENFEGLTAGDALNVSDAKDTDKNLLWESTEEITTENAVVTAYADGEKTPSSGGGNNYLKIETGEPLYRKVYNLGSDHTGEPQPISSGLYFEGDVQFSPYEEDVDTTGLKDDGTKLLVYIKGTEETTDAEGNTVKGTTNFVVVAGHYNNDNDIDEKKYYVCDDIKDFDYSKETWHHLLIKAYLTEDKTYSYFKVFVDGTALTCAEEKGTSESSMANIGATGFPSMDKGSATTLSGVGFKGTGSVDNLVWTTEDPDPTTYTYVFTWDSEQGNPVVTIDGKVQEIVSGDQYTYTEAQVKSWSIDFDEQPGYVNWTSTSTETTDSSTGITITTIEFTATKAAVSMQIGSGDTNYYVTLDEAITALEDVTDTATVQLRDNITTTSDVEFPESSNIILDLNGCNLTINSENGLYGGTSLVINNSQEPTYGYVTAASEIYAETLTINGGAFSVEPSADNKDVIVPSGKKLGTKEIDETTWYVLVDDGGSTEPEAEGGTIETDSETGAVTITAVTNEDGSITLSNVDDCEIDIPSDVKVTSINATINDVSKIHIKYTNADTKSVVDITGAFSVTTKDNVTTIALNPEASVTFTNEDGKEVTVTVMPELDTTDDSEPFAVGDSVSATVKAIPGLTYQLLGSEDLTTTETKNWTGIGDPVIATNTGTVTLEDTSDKGNAKFYVIKVSR